MTPEQCTVLLGDLANKAHISGAAIKRARTGLPSFSTAKWAALAPGLGLNKKVEWLRLDEFAIPVYFLPPSFHESVFERAWRTQDVYQERYSQGIDAARIRMLEPYLVPIMAIFQGRVIDMPEAKMAETKYSTGGEVEHEILVMGGTLFVVVELKLNLDKENNLAQLFLELLSAAEANAEIDFGGLRVYGLLTDLSGFEFYSYDPATKMFYVDETVVVNNTRELLLSDMIYVTNKIFSILLSGFMEGLRASRKESLDKVQRGDLSSPDKPTDRWDAALEFAKLSCAKFGEPVGGIQDIEEKSTEALELLTQSVRCVPRTSLFTGKSDPLNSAGLQALARQIVENKHLEMLQARHRHPIPGVK